MFMLTRINLIQEKLTSHLTSTTSSMHACLLISAQNYQKKPANRRKDRRRVLLSIASSKRLMINNKISLPVRIYPIYNSSTCDNV